MRAAERLVALGYRDVLEYPGGLKEWRRTVGTVEGRAAEERPGR